MSSYISIWITIVISLPYLFGSNQKKFVPSGSIAVLTCDFQTTTEPLFWRGPVNLTVYSITDAINMDLEKAERLRIHRNLKGQNILSVINFTKSDAGLYRCDTAIRGRTMEQEFRVTIAEPPRNMTLSYATMSKTAQLKEGHTTTVQCSIENGIPSSDLSLILRDSLLNSSSKSIISYTFTVKRYHHLENLTCTANNSYFSLTKYIQLNVNLLPKVMVTVQPTTCIEEGIHVTLMCDYKTNVNPNTVKWFKEDEIIYSADQRHLRFTNVTRHNSGNYSCHVRNWLGTGTDSIEMTVHYKPYLIDATSSARIKSDIGQSTNISFTIGSETKPEVSWTRSSGGKIGYWKIISQHNHTFLISSTVMPYEENHLGKYGVRVRNDFGSTDLFVFLVHYIIGIHPHYQSCNMSTAVEISCNITSDGEKVDNIWEQKFGNKIVRNITGTVTKNSSVLRISFCDYRDAGYYICKWTTPSGVYTSTSKLSIHGQPILIKQRTTQKKTYFSLEVLFYSKPEPQSATWYYNDKIFSSDEGTLGKNMTSTSVDITVYKNVVTTNGYVATLKVSNHHGYNIFKFGCKIENKFGYLDISFDEKAPTSIQTLENEGIDNDTSVKDTSDRRVFIYGGTSVSLLILLLALTITIWKLINIKGQKRKLILDQLQRNNTDDHDGHGEDISQRNSLSTVSNPSYDEIDSVHYQSVEWRNYSFEHVEHVEVEFDLPSHENSDSNMLNPSLQYNGLNHSETDQEYEKYEDQTDDVIPEYLEVIHTIQEI